MLGSDGSSTARRGRAERSGILALLLIVLAALCSAAPLAAAEAETASPTPAPLLWDYRTVFVVWDDQGQDWRADWNDGSSTLGLEDVLDNEASVGWELDTITHEQFDLIAGPDRTRQEARRLRLIFRRPLDPAAATPAPTSAPPTSAPETDASVAIIDFAFQPASLEVPVGTTVTWTNDGNAQHTATATDGSFDSGFLSTGMSSSHTFLAPGTVGYACLIHPGMVGSITVG